MVKLNQVPPDPNTIDWNNPQNIKDWCLQVYLCIDELARKAKSQQIELRSGAPTAGELEEGEEVRATNNNIYEKINGNIRTISTS